MIVWRGRRKQSEQTKVLYAQKAINMAKADMEKFGGRYKWGEVTFESSVKHFDNDQNEVLAIKTFLHTGAHPVTAPFMFSGAFLKNNNQSYPRRNIYIRFSQGK